MVDEGSNLGLQVVVRTLGGSPMDMKLIRFASGRNHHQSKHPMLVLFTDDGRRSMTLESTGEISDHDFFYWFIMASLCLSLKLQFSLEYSMLVQLYMHSFIS